jgi:hypothetical protein
MSIGKIGFLETYAPDENGGIMGAILVTDADTKPLEFRVTAPIKTTNFQKTLYGDVLLEHVLVELISVPLINALNEELDIILVKDNLFLGANDKQGVRVIRVFGEDDASKGNKGAQELKGYSGNGKMFAETSKKYEAEMGQIKDLLNEIAENRNLLEPFDRLKQACEQVHLQKTSD